MAELHYSHVNSSMRLLASVLLVASITLIPSSSRAAPLLTDGGSGSKTSSTAADEIYGVSFEVASTPVLVTSLGILDVLIDGETLVEDHNVGLWDSDLGVLLGSVTVTNSDFFDNGFKYKALTTSILLVAGTEYVLGAHYPNPVATGGDHFRTNDALTQMIPFVAPEFTYIEGRYGSSLSSPLTEPTIVDAFNGYVGPNLLFNTVPEPASLALFSVGLAGFMALRRRRS